RRAGRDEALRIGAQERRVQLEAAAPPLVVRGQFLQLLEAERRAEFGRLEVPADVVEDEEVVVPHAVEVLPEVAVAFARSEQLWFRTTTPSPVRQATVDERRIVEHYHAAVSGTRDDVREREARDRDVGARAGRCAAESRAERIARILDHREPVPVRDRADA